MLTTTQAAERLGIAPVTARKWAGDGLFPHAQKVGRDWLIPERDVETVQRPPRGAPRKPPKQKHPGTRKRAPDVRDTLRKKEGE